MEESSKQSDQKAEPTTAPLLSKSSAREAPPAVITADTDPEHAAGAGGEPAPAASAETTAQASSNEPAETPDEHQARIDYLRSLRAEQPAKRGRNIWKILAVVLLLLLAAGAAYWFVLRPKPASHTSQSSAQQSAASSAQQPSSDQNASGTTKPYSSTPFGLSFQYPSNWNVNETTVSITVVSPKNDLTKPNGQKVSGLVTMTIQHRQLSLPEFSKGNATAVRESNKIAYTNPSPTQRAQTFLSYLQYAATTEHGGLDGIYVTGNLGYQKDQAIPQADVVKVDPLITVTFASCSGSSCTQPLTIAASSWTGDLQTTVQTMLQSLTIQ